MRPPIFVRPMTGAERAQVQAGLRSPDAFVMRRCQIVLASERGERVPQIAHWIGCDEQTVRNAVHGFNQTGSASLQPGSKRPKQTHAAFNPETAEKLRALLHR